LQFSGNGIRLTPNVEKVRILIKDIEELRASKLHASLRELEEYHEAVRIPNASAAELNR
jgi:hypothetical protein